MITHNHELYIRKAIEGVVSQQADFLFELIIGEDCSTDRTREICLEYQKMYPAIIRVLISDYNVGASGNLMRVSGACRGKYIAWCEGDDGWIAPDKLARQIAAFAKYPSLVVVSTGAQLVAHNGHLIEKDAKKCYSDDCLILGADIYNALCVSFRLHFFSCSVMFDRIASDRAKKKHSLFFAKLFLGDTTLWLALALEGDYYHLVQPMVFYRKSLGSVTRNTATAWKVDRDGWLVRYYFARKVSSDKAVLECILANYRQCLAEHYILDGHGVREHWRGLLLALKEKCFLKICIKFFVLRINEGRRLAKKALGWVHCECAAG
jgi:glycosyltransferase involved in cell wall biosynthesis